MEKLLNILTRKLCDEWVIIDGLLLAVALAAIVAIPVSFWIIGRQLLALL